MNNLQKATLSSTVIAALFFVTTSFASAQASPVPFSQDAKVSVLGQVVRPGTFIFQPVRVGDAILAAGGLTKDADSCKIVVRRGYLIDPAHAKEIRYDFGKVREGKAADLDLQPGDVIDVPKRSGKKGIFGKLESALKSVGKGLGSVARPLLQAASPALTSIAEKAGLLRAEDKPEAKSAPASLLPTSRSAPSASNLSPLEDALLKAIASESPEVRERILKQVQAILSAPSK